MDDAEGGDTAKLPRKGSLHNYQVGFECQDLSHRNTARRGLDLEVRPGEECSGRSMRTLMDSLYTVQQMRPLTFNIENVGGCPAQDLGTYIQELLPQYQIMCWRLDACDFLGASSRFRMHLTGVLRSHCQAPESARRQGLMRCQRPPHDVQVCKCLLGPSSPEVKLKKLACNSLAPGAKSPAATQWSRASKAATPPSGTRIASLGARGFRRGSKWKLLRSALH